VLIVPDAKATLSVTVLVVAARSVPPPNVVWLVAIPLDSVPPRLSVPPLLMLKLPLFATLPTIEPPLASVSVEAASMVVPPVHVRQPHAH
jgi:hypothetical protein